MVRTILALTAATILLGGCLQPQEPIRWSGPPPSHGVRNCPTGYVCEPPRPVCPEGYQCQPQRTYDPYSGRRNEPVREAAEDLDTVAGTANTIAGTIRNFTQLFNGGY